jgi:molybdenum cofactor cytidylyltransferase
MVPGIVLAAGASSRMGVPKPLLMLGNCTFLRRILEAFRDGGVPSLVVVVRPGLPGVEEEVARIGFGSLVQNPAPEAGQLSSLLVGLAAVERSDVTGVLVTLADVPLISAATVRTVLARAALTSAPIVRAVHRGEHGHPVLFKRAMFDALRQADPSLGARAVVRSHEVEDVEVGDPGITEDVDTPEDYARLREGAQ